MTKNAAMEIWCPMVRRGRADDVIPVCISDRCAMWRWASPDAPQEKVFVRPWDATKEEHASPKPNETIEWEFVPSVGARSAMWVASTRDADARRCGYCGLAGKPAGVE